MTDKVITVQNLKKYYPVKAGFFSDLLGKDKKYVKAVDNISFKINKREIVGLAGESGSGKTTTGEIITHLQEATDGSIYYHEQDIVTLKKAELKNFKKTCQMIFQDPYETLNPRFTIKRSIEEPLRIHHLGNAQERHEKVVDALVRAELRPPEKFLHRYPHELSGGQRQRVAVARAIVLDPKILIADEPVSMLDVSIRAGILNLLKRLRDSMDLSMLYISHDLSTIKYICDKTVILYLGKIVEMGPTNLVIDQPAHPYTQALIASVPVPDPEINRKGADISDDLPDQIDLPPGCRFWPRCKYTQEICKTGDPELIQVGDDHFSACLLNNKIK